ncbi:protein-arginine deiminase family protein [Actinosynnema sp. ALI-1.44]|uniref:protein-arginine deiminase family protein n=1 Tax=Actinosynnema sp. ALI-1.44 TaxID=1933779 RepID=UPI00143CF962|nr:protein-arginine deiminase family protein [Actinosynnema sp. ALI-1.44]
MAIETEEDRDDPRLAVDLLRKATVDGHGDAFLYEGTSSEKVTVDAVLADEKFMQGHEFVAERIDGQVATVLEEVGMREDELVRVPVLRRGYT